ncbi:MAG: uroporphyrinogen-III synthase [Crocinitomicaceae bacterium]|nr:uroporphyrinogen-III synthase [Crocinitomicaceae bacterium]
MTEFNWIFFSSKNGVQWALNQNMKLEATKVGAIGKPTAKFLEQNGIAVHFCGKDDQPVEEISIAFNSIVGENEKVLFPLSSISKKSVLKHFKRPYSEIEAYKTVLDPILFDVTFDYLVFTSPSNFEGFFSANSVSPEAKVIAIGETTKREIQKYLNIPIFMPEEKTEKAIYALLKNLIPSSDSDQ